MNGETLAAIPQIEESPMEKGKPFSFDVKFQSGFSNFQDLQNFVIISCRDNCQSPSGWKSGNGYNFVGNVRKGTHLLDYTVYNVYVKIRKSFTENMKAIGDQRLQRNKAIALQSALVI